MNQLAKKNILHLEDVCKRYDDNTVLDDIDLSIAEGEFCTMVGASGSGKSTLFNLILGQEVQTSGAILVDNEPVGLPSADRGIVYQGYSLFEHFSVLKNVMLGRFLSTSYNKWWFGGERKRAKILAMEYLTRVGLGDHANKWPHELSGGQRQRVAIIQALINKPRILLMDEPFGALDHETRRELQIFLLEMWKEHNMTVLFVTHDLEEALFLGTRILGLSQHYTDGRGNGKDVQHGARIKKDIPLEFDLHATGIKHSKIFLELKEEIRREVMDPESTQNVKDFNLKHPDSFQTLTEADLQ